MSALLLLVEDNELNRDMLSRRLERKVYVIQMAADGAQGVSMAMELRPALILMDLSLPVMDGWEAIRRLTANIPVIALTAHARAEDEKTAREAGANDFDTKPINLNRLVGKIEHLLTTQATGTLPENP
ncbi:MAG: response regulator [Verrucomicrobia bacterium]|nr:response regulator [Verrucomicrobiota bacterium]